MDFKKINFLVMGQLKTSRTEALEDYLKSRVNSLVVIGIMSPYSPYNGARCTLYKNTIKTKEFSLPSFIMKRQTRFNRPLLVFSFLSYVLSAIISVIILHRKYDLCVGISAFPAMLGLILKKAGYVNKVIYYSIDYYPKLINTNFFNKLVSRTAQHLDKFCIKSADLVWHISPRIPEVNKKFMNLPKEPYIYLIVPLCYNKRYLRFRSLEEVERWTICFVGTLVWTQGVQLVIESMPNLLKDLPQIKLRIIGHGSFRQELTKMVDKLKLKDKVIFHGFINNEEEVLDIVSRCAIGVAPWILTAEDNSFYADPGKPKLYAFCGLPTIITRGPAVSGEIEKRQAGISINYDKQELRKTIIDILKDEDKLRQYRKNAFEFAKDYVAENLFDHVFNQTLEIMGPKD